MAKEGKDAEEILQYFFEGTKIREVASIVSAGADDTEKEESKDVPEKTEEGE